MKGKIILGSIGLALILVIAVFLLTRDHGGVALPPRHGDMAQFKAYVVPREVPAFDLLDANDRPISSASFTGKITLVNLWATWCAPCVKEMPALQALTQAESSDRFAVVTISQDHAGRAAVSKFFGDHHLSNLPAYLDPSMKAANSFKIRGLPTTILLDAQGRELGQFEGAADWSGHDAVQLIDWYLSARKAQN